MIEDLVGQELVSEWRAVDQSRIDEFARATDDAQWIHVDPAAAADGPFGTTIAHGFLTLSLVVPMFAEALPPLDGYGMTLNYGLNRVRFTSPVPSVCALAPIEIRWKVVAVVSALLDGGSLPPSRSGKSSCVS